ncbi:Pih1p [Kluyveromyces lactis]|uniref:KLLA0C10318p n=1 Tax=Kluyveromyces lactis (strain ATCC 8585 / CBS 2359 / DSM 70799 / NBRC 1267 / NRRL Y-1140 / WM37) TaxID=284590 RepID=Q6CTT0_KLULA|nr:uncharacterized protein KLLA0_C10318g [Kluyveromyces lactis]CAH01510.1 KLLA0C10318p [Kluyveromyces lactis]|eukprot:XP_452659.1 uncharacterized protein KLLA0_C10318g [Kluyveromyces lactis]
MSFLLRPLNDSSSNNSNNVIRISPEPCFVVKSKVINPGTTSLSSNAKIFINICHNDQIPLPEIDFNPAIVYPLIINNQWEIPIVTSSIREDVDKKGNVCYVSDCCINTKCVSWIQHDLQLREIVVEWCLESCELRAELEISRDNISFPKLKKKGDTIPELEILREDLTENYEETINDLVNREQKEPVSIIEKRRDFLAEDEPSTGELPPLIPIDQSSRRKPLIEEIEDLSLHETKKPKVEEIQKKSISYELSMGKPKDTSEFLLKIEVTSELNSSLDYNIKYDAKSNKLIIKNTNLGIYPEKKLKVPLPDIFNNPPKLECFFVKPERRLIIFL